MKSESQYTSNDLNRRDAENLPGRLGLKSTHIGDMESVCEMQISPDLLAINGYLHAGCIVTLADTTAGYGCMANLPHGAHGFTTIELKTNLIGTARSGKLTSIAKCIHAGKTTQVWDSSVKSAQGKVIAEFRCTQLILYPKPSVS
ncbi:MAG: hotdog fold thioesterase [Gammaproteobacteria bacterium]|nr:hotdog fold thioesterase [Gammaproteobacteria bacterium]